MFSIELYQQTTKDLSLNGLNILSFHTAVDFASCSRAIKPCVPNEYAGLYLCNFTDQFLTKYLVRTLLK